jgi:hypothetical protein
MNITPINMMTTSPIALDRSDCGLDDMRTEINRLKNAVVPER